jgi:hypothetical protein
MVIVQIVVFWNTDVLEEHTASIFRVKVCRFMKWLGLVKVCTFMKWLGSVGRL